MSVFRKYNETTKRWEPVASADATTIFSSNPKITPTEETTSVEDILVRDRSDIELLKKNVSWLAKHGGGGGYGPGGSTSKAEIQILSPIDNTTPTNNIIWKDGIQAIAAKVVSSYTGTYRVVVRINGKQVYTVNKVNRNTIINIPTSVMGIGKNSVTLQVAAYDESEMEYTGECKISIASVELQKPTATTLTQNQLLNSSPVVTLTYRTTIPGNYRMYYSDTMITYDSNLGWRDSVGALDDPANNKSQYIDMIGVGTTISNLSVNITDIYGDGSASLINKNAAPGIYTRYFVMVSSSDQTICSSVQAAQINVTVTNGLLVSPQFGTDENSPYSISLDGVLDLKFIVYSGNTGTYSYSVWYDGKQISANTDGNKTFGTVVTDKISISSIIDKPGAYKLTIKANSLGITAEADVYIRATKALAEMLTAYKQDIEKYNIFDFTFWDNAQNLNTSGESINPKFQFAASNKLGELKQNINIYNKGSDSGSTKVYYKMHHTCCAKIDSNGYKWFPESHNDIESIIPGQDYQFTLSLAYNVGPEVDDNATIFYMGNYDPVALGGTGKGTGILVTAHGYYIRIEGTTIEGVLSDNDFTQFDVVMLRGTGSMTGYTHIYIYQNGTLLQATRVTISSNVSNLSLYSFKEMLIGCRSLKDVGDHYEVTNNINMDLYSVKLYRCPLNDGQIICNYINNYANRHRLIGDNALDPTLIDNLLKNNSILADADVPAELDEFGKDAYDEDGNKIYNTSKISTLFDMQTGQYNWGVSMSGNDIVLGSNLQKVPIPIVTISGLNWKYSEFISTSTTLTTTTGNLRYIDGINEISSTVTVDPQGTTTLQYNIKNIDITFMNCLFSPKDSWFPEQIFTLKADVVDSGHLNNAVIGTFVNDCLNETSMINKDAFPVQAKIQEYKKQNGNMMPNTMNLKATIEGFPVLLILDFASETGDVRDPRVMGIYSFNLGRKSNYNQGFEILKCLRSITGEVLNPDTISFPSLFGIPQASDKDTTYNAYCFEGERSFNNSITGDDEIDINDKNANYDYASVLVNPATGRKIWLPVVSESGGYVKYNDKTIYDDNGNVVAWNKDNVKKYLINPDGYFWSNHKSYAGNLLWKMVYAANTNEAWGAFERLNRCIAEKMEYSKGSAIKAYNTNVNQYEVVSAQGEALERKRVPGSTFSIWVPQAPEPLEISVKNSAFYYVVCMLFGLVDNFGKNMQMKHWTSGSENEQMRWSPTFYDMDTALGIDNTGGQTIPPTVFDESIINTPENKVAMMFSNAPQSTNGLFTVYSNKLWGALESHAMQDKYQPDYGSKEDYHVLSKMWSELRTSKLTSVENFVNEYLHTQLHNCGEFMYNYDYNVKYLSTSQIHMLHGNRLSFIKNWLAERIAFLDSVFGYKNGKDNESNYLVETATSSAPYITPYNVPWKNQVDLVHNSAALSLPIITNKSVIMRTNIGNNSISYVYIPKNTRTSIPVADSLNTQNIQTWINNSDCIIDINLQGIDLTNILPQMGNNVVNTDNSLRYPGLNSLSNIYNQFGSFSSLKKLDLRSCNLTANLDFFRLFKTWDSSPYGIQPEAFSLQNLNLSGVKYPNLEVDLNGEISNNETIPSIYKSPFTNITSIDVSDSNISNISIPKGVSLYSLNIQNSNISQLSLSDQPVLSTPSFNGCRNLERVDIINCNRFINLEFDGSVQSLKTLNIQGCQNLESIVIDAEGYDFIPNVTIQDCPKLKKVIIERSTSNEDLLSNRKLILSNTDALEEVSLKECIFESIEWDGIYEENGERKGLTKLNTLDISKSKVDRIYNRKTGNFAEERVIDLLGFESDALKNIILQDNECITEIYFSNIEDKPFALLRANSFKGCKSLNRVYGNIEISAKGIFSECVMFSIHGVPTKDTNVTFNGIQVHSDDFNVWYHPMDLDILTETGVQWQPGDKVTNMKLNVKDASELFKRTRCTTFDAYYILQNMTDNVQNISYMFSASGVSFSWGENGETGETYDNSPHRYLFSRCSNITNINSIFEGSIGSAGCKLVSPYMDGDTFVPGLYTPLKNILTMASIFGNMGSAIADKNLLRCLVEGEQKYEIRTLKDFSPRLIVNDVRDVDYSLYKAIISDPFGDYIGIHGNLSGFFVDCPNLTNSLINVLNNVLYINYDSFNRERLGIPENIKVITNVLISDYASGTINLNNIFDNPINVTDIYSSFRVGAIPEENDEIFATLNINSSLFEKFENIVNIGHHTSGEYKTSVYATAFSGYGLKKVSSDNSFPYDLLKNNLKLKSFIGFFMDADLTSIKNENGSPIEFPGGLFKPTTLIENISYCFYNVKTAVPYVLSEDSPFAYCPKLNNVSYMFGKEIAEKAGKSSLRETYIPAKLFFHGETEITKNITGSNLEIRTTVDNFKVATAGRIAVKIISEDTVVEGNITTNTVITHEYLGYDPIEDSNNEIIVTPSTSISEVKTVTRIVTSADGSQIPQITTESKPIEMEGLAESIKTYTISYPIVNTSIENMEGCFQGADIKAYEHTWTNDMLPESNPDYQPFKYSYVGGTWKKVNVNNYRYTYMWLYDGNRRTYKAHIDNDIVKSNIEKQYPTIPGYTYELYLPDDAWDPTYTNIDDLESAIPARCIKPGEVYGGDSSWDCCGSAGERFCCAPDLFRYCKPNANITNIFYCCGMASHNIANADRKEVFNTGTTNDSKSYGLKGRLCPYLLKPLTELADLSQAFYACSFLGGYKKNDFVYMIPETFFSYINSTSLSLNGTFSLWNWPAFTSLNVFKFKKSIQLNVESAFERPLFTYYDFDGIKDVNINKTKLSNIFASEDIYVQGMQNCFMVNQNVNSNNSSVITDQPVYFNNIFNRYNKNVSNSDRYVFCGYNFIGNPSDKNERFENKTLREDASRHNYDAKL